MKIIQDLIENWHLILGAIIMAVVFVSAVIRFFRKPSSEQIKNLKEWLVWAVSEAEKELGSKTGILKLRLVYDWAIARFPCVQFISFHDFSIWVDEALEKTEKLIQQEK